MKETIELYRTTGTQFALLSLIKNIKTDILDPTYIDFLRNKNIEIEKCPSTIGYMYYQMLSPYPYKDVSRQFVFYGFEEILQLDSRMGSLSVVAAMLAGQKGYTNYAIVTRPEGDEGFSKLPHVNLLVYRDEQKDKKVLKTPIKK